MPVLYDAANSAAGNGLTASVSLTVAANSLVIVGAHLQGGPTASNPLFDGNAMTLIAQTSNDLYVYRYHGHSAGSRTASITRSTSGDWVIGVVSVTGFETSSPIGTYQTGTSTEAASVTSDAIDTGSSDWLIVDAALMIIDAMAADAAQTERVSRDSYSGGFQSFGMSTKTGSASPVTMSWTAGATFGDNDIIAVPIRPAAGGGTSNVVAWLRA